jgi:hypothetical protein
MAQFHPSSYVREEISSFAFVPMHVQALVMSAFADAIENNVTQSDMLDALAELFTETVSHVPFCSEEASQEFTMQARTSADVHQYAERLAQAVPWDNVPIVQGEARAPPNESDVDRVRRIQSEYEWDPYVNKYMAFNKDCYFTETAGRRTAQEKHPMRSFSPASMTPPTETTGVPGAKTPARAHASSKIHSGLGGAAASAAAFCRDPKNWPAFYKHVLLVWMARFWKASTRFVDNSNGMMTVSEKNNQVKFFANGMHLMHGSRLPVLGRDPNAKDTAEACDIVILRTNIKHEMLGVIMGRGARGSSGQRSGARRSSRAMTTRSTASGA